ncbi:hypothetical protein A6A03_19270 [Chloroflexus islandicus]|uniref:Uncharacterized protein n=1 Tax=Chloroflexus islandicus TaxID=1707952 RepID=A0A178M0D9_9CHLR|nr:hypothetical protein A6A03_19270 [Chloroflexus islandicus]
MISAMNPRPNANPIITLRGGPPALPPEKLEPPLPLLRLLLPLLRERKLLCPEPRQLIWNLLVIWPDIVIFGTDHSLA